MLIRLQRIYNLWSIHAIILSFLDVLQSFYRNFISFLGLTYWPSASCYFFACFLHRRKSIPNGVQTQRNSTEIFYGPEGTQWARAAPGGVPRGGHNPPGCGWKHPPGASMAHYVPSGTKKISVKFRCVWTPFGIDFLRCKKQARNSNWNLALCQ